MDYSKITVLRKKYNIGRDKMAEILGISPQGLDKKIKKETYTVKDIETFASYVNVAPAYFFESVPDKVLESETVYNTCKNCLKNEARIELLNKQLKEKDSEIARLNRELGRIQPGERAKVG